MQNFVNVICVLSDVVGLFSTHNICYAPVKPGNVLTL